MDAPPRTMQLVLHYDGARFAGWQRQRDALAQQLGPRVVGKERQQGAAIQLRQRLAQGEQRRVQIGRGTERVGQ